MSEKKYKFDPEHTFFYIRHAFWSCKYYKVL